MRKIILFLCLFVACSPFSKTVHGLSKKCSMYEIGCKSFNAGDFVTSSTCFTNIDNNYSDNVTYATAAVMRKLSNQAIGIYDDTIKDSLAKVGIAYISSGCLDSTIHFFKKSKDRKMNLLSDVLGDLEFKDGCIERQDHDTTRSDVRKCRLKKNYKDIETVKERVACFLPTEKMFDGYTNLLWNKGICIDSSRQNGYQMSAMKGIDALLDLFWVNIVYNCEVKDYGYAAALYTFYTWLCYCYHVQNVTECEDGEKFKREQSLFIDQTGLVSFNEEIESFAQKWRYLNDYKMPEHQLNYLKLRKLLFEKYPKFRKEANWTIFLCP